MIFLNKLVNVQNLKIAKSGVLFRSFALSRVKILNNVSKVEIIRSPQKLLSRNKSIFRHFKHPTEKEYKLKDKISEEFMMIYHNKLHRYLLVAHIICYMCAGAIILLVVSGKDLSSTANFQQFHVKPDTVEWEMLLYITVLATMAAMLYTMIYKMPLRIYTDPGASKYLMIFHDTVPGSYKTIGCTNKDVFKYSPVGVLPWKNSNYFVKNRNIILVDNYFRTPADLHIMMDIQKPVND